MTNLPYIITPAKYAKGKFTIRCLDSKDGWKGLTNWLIDEIGLKYVGRDNGYRASAAQVKRFEALFAKENAPDA